MMAVRLVAALVVGMVSVCYGGDGSVKAMTEASCRDRGFDPSQLACATCDLLPYEFVPGCQSCCQSWRPNLSGDDSSSNSIWKVEAAVLVCDPTADGDLGDFLRDDWAAMVDSLTPGALVRVDREPNMDAFAYMRMGASPTQSTLYLFRNKRHAQKSTDPDTLAKFASEQVVLSSLNRDEIKDMLQTILPSR